MLLFRCAACGRPSDQAARCSSCGARTFTLTREPAEREAAAALPPPVPIEQARARRRRKSAR